MCLRAANFEVLTRRSTIGIQMDANKPANPQDGSHTSFKAFGIEFSGPTWLAVIFIATVAVVAVLYLGSGQASDASQSDTQGAAAQAAPATASQSSE